MSHFRAPFGAPFGAPPSGPVPPPPAPPRISEKVSWEYPTPAPNPGTSVPASLREAARRLGGPVVGGGGGTRSDGVFVSSFQSSFAPTFDDVTDRDVHFPSSYSSAQRNPLPTSLPLLLPPPVPPSAFHPGSSMPSAARLPSPPRLTLSNDPLWEDYSRTDPRFRQLHHSPSPSPPPALHFSPPRRRLSSPSASSPVPPSRRRRRHAITLTPVRNILFSLADDAVDREYLHIFMTKLDTMMAVAKKTRSVVVVVVGAQKTHFRTVVKTVEAMWRDRTASKFDDDGDTWGSLEVRRSSQWRLRDSEAGYKTIVLMNGLIPPPKGVRIYRVLGLGVPIVGRTDAARLMAAWCDFLDLLAEEHPVVDEKSTEMDLWVEDGSGPEIAGIVDFAESVEGGERADMDITERIRDVAKREVEGTASDGRHRRSLSAGRSGRRRRSRSRSSRERRRSPRGKVRSRSRERGTRSSGRRSRSRSRSTGRRRRTGSGDRLPPPRRRRSPSAKNSRTRSPAAVTVAARPQLVNLAEEEDVESGDFKPRNRDWRKSAKVTEEKNSRDSKSKGGSRFVKATENMKQRRKQQDSKL